MEARTWFDRSDDCRDSELEAHELERDADDRESASNQRGFRRKVRTLVKTAKKRAERQPKGMMEEDSTRLDFETHSNKLIHRFLHC